MAVLTKGDTIRIIIIYLIMVYTVKNRDVVSFYIPKRSSQSEISRFNKESKNYFDDDIKINNFFPVTYYFYVLLL